MGETLKKCHVGAGYWSWGLNVEAVVMAERHALWESVSACAKRQKVAIRALPGCPKARPRGCPEGPAAANALSFPAENFKF